MFYRETEKECYIFACLWRAFAFGAGHFLADMNWMNWNVRHISYTIYAWCNSADNRLISSVQKALSL